ncbi:MAG TPA: XdhC family protein [Pirellulaceae bacterium]|nr:XdhC family protein [Pirellulaceae bacterium]
MREVVRQLIAALDAGRPVAYCRLVETRGSTPQKAGAMMLVYPDGSQAGTLGGGCVEAEVKRRAIALLSEGKSEVCTFQLDSDYGWDDGLICGGRMQILVEPIAAEGEARGYFRRLAELVDCGEGITEAIVFDAQASTLPAPTSYLFDAAGRFIAGLHTASSPPPGLVTDPIRPLASRPRPYAAHGIAYLPILPRCRLVIVGGGHVGKAVADLAVDLAFDVWVVDDREEFTAQERFPRAERRITGQIDQVLPTLEITPDTYCLIVTRGHNHDEEALFHLVDRGARYVGLIGSRRKIKMIYGDLLGEGISRDALAKVHAPLGIDIGSQTVPEIAVSICAELVAHRNLGTVPGRPRSIEF